MKRPPSIMPHGKKNNTLSGRLAGPIFQVHYYHYIKLARFFMGAKHIVLFSIICVVEGDRVVCLNELEQWEHSFLETDWLVVLSYN